MDKLAGYIVEQKLDQLSNIKIDIKDEQSKINWEDFNYPPFFKLIHYSPADLPADKKVMY